MPEMHLKEIASVCDAQLLGPDEGTVVYLETDSRKIQFPEKSLFVAIRGERHDGHAYITNLIERGIRMFLVLNDFEIRPEYRSASFIVVENTIRALHTIAAWHRKQIAGEIVAITGSNGKTMVKEWLFHCLVSKAVVSRSPKSYNSQIGVPLSLWMINPDADFALIEAGISRPGEMQKLANIIQPNSGIITNIGPAHQENFSTLEQKVNEKLKLFSGCKILYYCRDHELIHRVIINSDSLCGTRLISWSAADRSANLFVEEIRKSGPETHLSLEFSGNKFQLAMPFTDNASIENCIQIINFLLHKKFSIQEAQEALSSLTAVEMRLEQIKGIEGSTIINDSYNSDFNSLRIALDYLASQKQHAKHAIILSDIHQSGLEPESLYKLVDEILVKYKINKICMVGDSISRYSKLTEGVHKFESTDTLLADLTSLRLSNHAILIKGARKFAFEKIVSALSEKKHTTVLEINLNHLVDNLNYFRGLLSDKTRIMVMVKALSYGSGSYEIAQVLQHEHVDYLGVAFADEGILLRERGIHLPIMVMSPEEGSFDKIIEYNLEPEIFSFSGLESFARVVSGRQLKSFPIHLKIDTGMHRLGFQPSETERLVDEVCKNPNLKIQSVFTHLAASDKETEDVYTKNQIHTFNKVYEQISHKLNYKPMRHLLNSAGIERFPEVHYEMVRLGIGLHGISSGTKLSAVSSLKTRISQLKNLPAGETVGYNRKELLSRNSQIAIVPVGYADGLDRKLGNRNGKMIVNGKQVPIIGDVCMDMCMLDVTGVDAAEGDAVLVFGEENTITSLAQSINTIPYEILTNVSSRVKRVYIYE